MLSIFSTLLLLAHALTSQAVPLYASDIEPRSADAPFSVPIKDLQQAIVCPDSAVKPNTVLIVPGTGEKASSFFPNNFGALLKANGFNVCYLDTPNMSVGDMQITSEYVAYAIGSLQRSTASKINVLSHSQGGSDVQWALTFWPSTRAKVATFVALGPAWKGTVIARLVNVVRKALAGKNVASVLQQASGSKFLAALAENSGNKPLVPTTSIWTFTDEIVEPASSGILPGGSNIKIQDICSIRTTGHFLLVTDSVSQYFALQSFKTGKAADPSALSATDKALICKNVLPKFKSVKAGVSFTIDVLISAISTVVTGAGKSTEATAEPPLAKYVK